MGSPSIPTGAPRQGWRERYANHPKASKRLSYLTHKLRAYVAPDGTPWFVLVDLFRAIDHPRNSPLRKRIKDPQDIMQVLAWVPNAATPAGGGGALIQATNAGGLGRMLSAGDEKARALYDWLVQAGLPELQAGG